MHLAPGAAPDGESCTVPVGAALRPGRSAYALSGVTAPVCPSTVVWC